ncbi:uncharacterized protein LOC135090105 [Scylla paramamosain]|uniref:uncharacterized protein LOC135090105 n=1 Tax=Scylla paramamosain TaxID=85552 RepID=UPI003083BC74
MPVYKGVLSLEDEGPDTPTVHLFDYSSEGDTDTKSNYRKQLIAVESCIYLGRRNLAAIKSQSRGENTKPSSQSANGIEENTENSTNENTRGKEEIKLEEEERKGEEGVKDGEVNGKETKEGKVYLKEGKEFQGYILKCPNGPYDYAMKVWDTGRAAPPEVGYPREGEEVEAVVVDRAEDLLTVACGPNIAFARRKTFLCNGVDPDDLSLPFARLKVSLRRLQEREALVPAAGWEATPTQVVVPPYDIY